MSIVELEKQMDDIGNILTFDEIVEIVKKMTNDNYVRVLDYRLNDYSKDKYGFSATHHILNITVQKSNTNTRETITTFVKIIELPVVDGLDENVDVNSLIANKESFFLKTLVSQFMDGYNGEKWCPIHYYTKKNIVVMEDLKSNGYKLVPIEQFVDNHTILKSVLTSLARFHSCSILAEARMSQAAKRPIALNEHYEDSFPEMIFLTTGAESYWFNSVTKLTCELAERLNYDPVLIRNLFGRSCELVKPSNIHRNTVCHGDVHANNVMFADGSPLLNCVLVDFQTYRYAPLVTDILQFLYINTTTKFREQHEASLIEYYHSVLTETIYSNDSTKIVQIPTLEDIFKAMEDLRLFGLVIACIYHPIVFLDPEFMKKHAKDAEFHKNFIIGDRLELTLTHMKNNVFFKNKVEQAIRELVEKSS